MRDAPDSARVTAAGLVSLRQRPGTTKGMIFLTLEDETGVVKAIVWRAICERCRRAVIVGRMLRVSGRVQRAHSVTQLIAERIEDISALLYRLLKQAPPQQRRQARPVRSGLASFLFPRRKKICNLGAGKAIRGSTMGKRSLPEIGFLSDISADLKDMLSEQATELTLRPGEILFEQGDIGDTLFAIMSGAVEFSVLAMDGRKLTLDMMRTGALFGEITLFDPGARTATATAVEDTTLCRVRHADVLKQIRHRPDLAVDMIHLAGQRMRWMGRQLNEQVFLPLPTRLARKVLHLAPDEVQPPFKLSLSQAELAEFVGATREAVSKILASWKREGVVDSARGGLVVKDMDALSVLAEPDQI